MALPLLIFCGIASASSAVVSYPVPACYTVSDQVTITAEATTIPVIANTAIYDYCHLSFSGNVAITITTAAPIGTYSISPKAFAIPATTKANTLTFTLHKSQYLIVKIDNLREVVIAADDLEAAPPSASGEGIYNVSRPPFNADATGSSLATAAVQSAIDAAANHAGGGTVVVPDGVFRCGSLILRSNVTLNLSGGAVLRASDDPADFTTKFHKSSLKMDGAWFVSTVPDSENITIRGRGTIDGNGTALRTKSRYLTTILMPLCCRNFTVDGVIFRDSGLWAVTPTRSSQVTIRDTKHFNENDVNFEDDAMDIQECQDVTVTHTIAISEDDTYSTKTWDAKTDIARNWPGAPQPLSHVTFDDCFAWSRCATFKLGFGNSQTQTDVTFKNSYSYKSMRAIAINHKWGTAPTRNIVVDNIDIEGFWPRKGNQSRWLDITQQSACPMSDITIRNCNVREPGSIGSDLKGFSATSRIQNVTLSGNTVNGVAATSLKALNVTQTNTFVDGVTVK